ncbi:MAG: DNA primase [Methylobacillus sp.]|jgi:hypothetical protein|nr:DNA primase [Methylobacillus sp.]
MTAHLLLNKLDRVRKTGKHSWRACCPAHQGANPTSLSVTETADGMVLVRCHAHECSIADIVAAVGLEVSDLFPESFEGHSRKPERMPFNPRDVLASMAKEAMVVALYGMDASKGRKASEKDHQRMLTAVGRLKSAAEVCHAS